MPLHKLAKIVRRRKRVGRGIGSRGAKSGRGQKGQKSRAGAHTKAGFEGGQTPLYMRLPKGRGSKQKFRSQVIKPQVITVRDLNRFAAKSIVGPGQLWQAGLLRQRFYPVKLIGIGSLPKQLTVRVHAATPQAEKQVRTAGGKVEIIPRA
ncbi:MAG: 50S ribosomal protein L15 [Candidatus Andersenbacteria bacterium]